MYSYEERLKAVKLYVKYDRRAKAAIRELGYPSSRHTLVHWYKEYEKTGTLHKKARIGSTYTQAQKEQAIQYYLTHGKCVAQTVKALGYPHRDTLFQWLNEALPERKKSCVSGGTIVEYSQEEKKQAIIDLCTRQNTAQEVAEAHSVSRGILYKWKKQLLRGGRSRTMSKKESRDLSEIVALKNEIQQLHEEEVLLKKRLYHLQLEYDVLQKTIEVLKKAEGINLITLTNQEKAEVIDALRKCSGAIK